MRTARVNSWDLRGARSTACGMIFAAAGFAWADVTITLEIGRLRDASGGVLSAGGGMWAVLAAAPGDALPGGLVGGASLSASDVAAPRADFGGATVEPGSMIGNAVVMNTGQVGADGVVSEVIVWTNADYQQHLQPGGPVGLYWFPGITGTSMVLPESGFVIGGMRETEIDSASGGDVGMTIPANSGQNLTMAYFDQQATGDSGSLPVERFTAIEVPASGYEIWRDLNFTAEQIAAGEGDPLADPDGDGLANLLEYATGSSPLEASPPPLAIRVVGNEVVLEFQRTGDPELRYRIEASDDLSPGSREDVVFESGGEDNVDGEVEVLVPLGEMRRFFRLGVGFADEAWP